MKPLATALCTLTLMAAPVASAWAGSPPGVAQLEHLLGAKNAGKVTKVFRGPDGFTGVVLQNGPQDSVGYITPDGRYFFVGMLLNLANGEDISQEAAHKYLQHKGVITGQVAATAANVANHLGAATLGPLHAQNSITLIFDPDTPTGKQALIDIDGMAKQIYAKNPAMLKRMAFRFVPVGAKAGWILSASNLGRIQRLQDLMKGQYPGSTTGYGQTEGNQNNNALRLFPIKPPLVIFDMPAAHLIFVTSAAHAVKHIAPLATLPSHQG